MVQFLGVCDFFGRVVEVRDVSDALEHCVPFVAFGEIESTDEGSREPTSCDFLLRFLYTAFNRDLMAIYERLPPYLSNSLQRSAICALAVPL